MRKIIEDLSVDIWLRIRDSEIFNIKQGEETLTDNVLLQIVRLNSSNLKILQTPKDKEPEKGTDWEWWIGNSTDGWLRYGVQAKKINPKTLRYDNLNHSVGSPPDVKKQIDILDKYCNDNEAIPIYCFYNYLKIVDLKKHYHCITYPYSDFDLGWKYAPLEIVKDAIAKRGCKNFSYIHSNIHSLPVRCLFSCPALRLPKDKSSHYFLKEMMHRNIKVYSKLPKELESALETGTLKNFPQNYYSFESGIYPQRIAIFITGENQE